MKALLRCLSLVLALCVGWVANAQSLGNYTYSTGVDATKWIAVSSSTNLLGTGNADSRASSLQSIGFSFPFASGVYTQYSVNSDGNLRLGTPVTGTSNYGTPFSSSNAIVNNPKINFLGCDGYFLDTIHYVYAENTVDANNDSLLVVEFCLGTFNSTTRDQRYKWQVHLYPNGNIEVVMASTAPGQAPNTSNQKGLCADASDGWIIASDNTATHFTAGSSTTWATGTWPAPNTYYRFVRPVVTCPQPTAITMHSLTPTAATLTFTPGGTETAWHGTITPGIMGYSDITLADTTVNLMFLTPNTEYTVTVRAICGAGDTSFTTSMSFHTPCTPMALPYTNNFDDITSSTTASTGVMPGCWIIGHRDNAMTAAQEPQVYYGSSNASSGSYSLRLFYNCYTALPLFQTPVDSLMMRFQLKQTSANYIVVVGVMDNPFNPATFVPVDTLNCTSTSSFEYQEIYFDGYAGNGQYIAFHNITTPNVSYVYSYNYIDDLEVMLAPSCRTPREVAVSNIGSSNATLSWTGNATSYMVAYGSDTTDMSTVVSNTNSITLTDLQSSTTYYVMVKALCSATDESEFSLLESFTTMCDPFTIPYSLDFDDLTTSTTAATGVMPNCWTIGHRDVTMSASQSPQVYYGSSNAHSGSYSLRLYYRGYVALPLFQTPVDSLMLKFWLKQTSASYLLEVGVMTDPNDASTFVPVDTINNTSTSAYEYKEILFNNYTGNGQFIAFHNITTPNVTYSYSYNYIDDLEVVHAPSCFAPDNLTYTNNSTTSTTVRWTGSAANYVVSYGTSTDSLTQVTVSADSIVLTGLANTTNYVVSVKAVCSSDDESEWSEPLYFMTTSLPQPVSAHLPYFDGFEGPNKWSLINDVTNKWFAGNAVSNTGNGSLYISNDNGASNAYTVSGVQWSYAVKSFAIVYGTYQFSFDWKGSGESNYDYLRAFLVPYTTTFEGGVSPTGATPYAFRDVTPEGWIALDGGGKLNLSSTWQTRVDTVEISAPLYKMVFVWANDGSGGTQPPAAIDNVSITPVIQNTCPVPTNPTVISVAATTATLSCDAPDSLHNSFLAQINDGITNYCIPSFEGTTLTIDSLIPNTTYTVRFATFCDTGSSSEWSAPVTFTTPCNSIVVDYANPFNETFDASSATRNCWSVDTRNYAPNWTLGEYSYNDDTYEAYDSIAYFFDGDGSYGYSMLVSPVFDLSMADSASLSFMYLNPEWYGDQNEFAALYRNNDTAAWDTLAYFNSNVTTWTSVTLTIPVVSATTQIAFDAYDAYGYCVAIDNVSIQAYRDYCIPAPTSCDNQGITNVTFGTGSEVVNNSQRPTSAPYFGDYTSLVGAVPAGESLSVDITYATGYTYGTIIWVDWNRNHVFEGNEVAFVGEAPNSNPTLFNATVNVPAAQDTGLYRMRIAGADSYYNNYIGSIAAAFNANPCPASSYTIVHDYTLHVTAPLSCARPSAITLNSLVGNTATLSFTPAGNETSWVGSINPAIMGVSSLVLTDTVVTLTNLESNTTYTVAVRAICGAGDTSNACTFTFTTPCGTRAIPYLENFDNLDGTLPDCWVKVGSGTVAKYSSSSYSHSGSYSLKFNGSTSNLVVLPEMDSAINELEMSLWTRPESYTNSSCGSFSVGYVTDVNDASSFVAIDTYTYNSFSAVENRIVNFASAPANARIALRHNANSTSWYWFVDDIDIHMLPSCVSPSGVTASISSATSAVVTWNANASTPSYTVAYGTGNNPDSMATVNVNTNSVTLTGLAPETTYSVYVKSLCSANDESDWSAPVSFYTGYCLPNPSSVDGNGITNVSFGYGSETVNNSQTLTSAPYYGNFHNMVGAVPAGSQANLNITYATGYTYGTIVWVDWDHSLTFDSNEVVFAGQSTSDNPTVLNAGFIIPATRDTGMYRMRIAGADSYFDNYSGSIAAAAAADPCFSSTWAVAHDYTLHVTAAPSCSAPYDVTVNSVTVNSATVSWTANGSANSFVVGYTSDSVTFDSVTVTGTTATLTGLSSSTVYAVAVKAVCGATDQSEWSTPVYFTTNCAAIAVMATNPFYESFDMTSTTLNCWHSNGTEWSVGSSFSGSYTAYSGTSAYANGSGSGEDLLTSPILDLTGSDSATLSFVYINPEWYGDQNVLTVLYRTTAGGDWDTLGVYNTSVTTWTSVTLTLPTVTANTQIGFHYLDDYGYCVAIDSVVVAPIVALPATTVTIATADATMGTTVPTPGTYTFHVGDTMAATAVPASGYRFDYWIISMGILTDTIWDNPVSEVLPAYFAGMNFSITAHFALDQFTLNVVSANATMGSVTGSGLYNYGDTATITATPAANCHFVQWNDGDTNATRSIVVTGNATYTATFGYNPVTVLLVNADTNRGSVNPVPGLYTFNVGDTVSAQAIPATGYHFSNWTIGMGVLTDSMTNNPITMVIPTYLAGTSVTVTANFDANLYTIDVYANNSALGTVSGGGQYAYNSYATITATPAQHCNFVQWNDGDTNAVRSVLVTGNASYTATFQAIPQHEVTLTVVEPGYGTVTGAGLYYEGETVTITATPNEGYTFEGWTIDGTTIFSNENTHTFVMGDSDVAYIALFEEVQQPATLNIVISDLGSGSVFINEVETNVYQGFVGDTITLHAVANDGNRFVNWSGEGTENSTSATITYVIRFAETTITANFEPLEGIDDVDGNNIAIYSTNNNIIVSGAEQQTIRVFDVVGRLVAQRNNAGEEETIAMPNTGVYLVQVGDTPARRVVVRR